MSETVTPAPVATPPVDSLRSPQFVIAIVVLATVDFAVGMAFWRGNEALINTVVGLVVGSGFGGVIGFYFASSVSSQRKDAAPTQGTQP